MDVEQAGDWELMGRKTGREQACSELFRRHKDYVFRVACKIVAHPHTADDVVQEVFLRIYNMKKQFHKKAQFRTWLYRVTYNVCCEQFRTQRKQQRVGEALATSPLHAVPNNDEINRERPDMASLLDCLPPKQRAAVVFRYFEKLSIRDTAHAMGCRQGTVKSHLHKALRRLRQELLGRNLPMGAFAE